MGTNRKYYIRASAIVCTLLLGVNAASAVTAPPNAGDRIGMVILGHITPRCAVAARGGASGNFGQIMDGSNGTAAASTLDLPFTFDCNTGFTATLVSRHGGLAFDGGSATGFSSLVDYTATLGLQQGAGDLSLSCDSAQMRSIAISGPATASSCHSRSESHGYVAADGIVKLKLKAGGAPLLHGTYSDELVLQITPNLGG